MRAICRHACLHSPGHVGLPGRKGEGEAEEGAKDQSSSGPLDTKEDFNRSDLEQSQEDEEDAYAGEGIIRKMVHLKKDAAQILLYTMI